MSQAPPTTSSQTLGEILAEHGVAPGSDSRLVLQPGGRGRWRRILVLVQALTPTVGSAVFLLQSSGRWAIAAFVLAAAVGFLVWRSQAFAPGRIGRELAACAGALVAVMVAAPVVALADGSAIWWPSLLAGLAAILAAKAWFWSRPRFRPALERCELVAASLLLSAAAYPIA